VRVLLLFFAAFFSRAFLIAFAVNRRLAVAMGTLVGIARGILHVPPRLLRFAFHLLRRPFHLGVRVARPFTYLAFYTSSRIVHCTFYPVLIHDFTSNLWLASVLGCAARMVCVRRNASHPAAWKSNRPSTRDQLDEQYHKRDYEKDVNKSPQGVRRNNAY